ncbi:MAG TPA: hypothetical protein QF924_21600 [Pseudomonadales bacterium]|jgi:hypothetical protein|nr:hypothetical protein [Pseudomonadales bacterium]|tara:strand:- start:181 stop:639 length:459 start_codon:yes stop_codon:yes gene_type:complete
MLFPSVEWFEAVQKAADSEAATFRRMGFCDATVLFLFRSGEQSDCFLLTFEDYGMTSVRELESTETPDIDFRLAADAAVWCEMIQNIRSQGEADLEHTLNRLQLPGTLELTAPDQQRADLFYRYNQTFQQFFNLAAKVPTEYSTEPTPTGST